MPWSMAPCRILLVRSHSARGSCEDSVRQAKPVGPWTLEHDGRWRGPGPWPEGPGTAQRPLRAQRQGTRASVGGVGGRDGRKRLDRLGRTEDSVMATPARALAAQWLTVAPRLKSGVGRPHGSAAIDSYECCSSLSSCTTAVRVSTTYTYPPSLHRTYSYVAMARFVQLRVLVPHLCSLHVMVTLLCQYLRWLVRTTRKHLIQAVIQLAVGGVGRRTMYHQSPGLACTSAEKRPKYL